MNTYPTTEQLQGILAIVVALTQQGYKNEIRVIVDGTHSVYKRNCKGFRRILNEIMGIPRIYPNMNKGITLDYDE